MNLDFSPCRPRLEWPQVSERGCCLELTEARKRKRLPSLTLPKVRQRGLRSPAFSAWFSCEVRKHQPNPSQHSGWQLAPKVGVEQQMIFMHMGLGKNIQSSTRSF